MLKDSIKNFCKDNGFNDFTAQEPELLRIALRYKSFKLWQGTAPCSENLATEPLRYDNSVGDGRLRLHNVTEPEIVFCPVQSKGKAPAVLVCPGGGYNYTSVEAEGYTLCSYFNSIGFSAFLLNYRCPLQRDAAFADAARAIRFIRYYSDEFNVAANQIGVIGFSAGAHLAARVSAPGSEPYPVCDEIDQMPFIPDYAAIIYPAYLATEDLKVAPEFSVTEKTPPTFIIQTEDDGIHVENALVWYKALKDAGVKAEMHLYECGGHGYGIADRPGIPVTGWERLAEKWFKLRVEAIKVPEFSKEVRS